MDENKQYNAIKVKWDIILCVTLCVSETKN